MARESKLALKAFQTQASDAFSNHLRVLVAQQTAPFAVFCVYIHETTYTELTATLPDIHANHLPLCWHAAVKAAIAAGTSASQHLIDDNHNHIAILVNPCTYEKSDELARLVRTRLLQDYPALRPSLSIAQADSRNINIEHFLAELCTNLNANIEASSSSIKVKRY